MTIECNKQGAVVIVKVAGRMGAESAPQFEQVCRDSIRDGAAHLVVDLAGLEYVSSMGLRSFLNVAKAGQYKTNAMLLCGMTGLVKQVFDMTHLTPLFAVYESTEAGLQSI